MDDDTNQAAEIDEIKQDADADGEGVASPQAEESLRRLSNAFARLAGEDVEDECGSDDEQGGPENDASAAGDVSAGTVRFKPSSHPRGPDDPQDEAFEGSVSPRTVVEAMLFVGNAENRPLSARQVAARLRGVSPQEVEQIVAELNRVYDERDAVYRIRAVGDGYRMELRDEFTGIRGAFYGRVKEARLNQSAVDVLSLVAYHQPISRETIDRLRGRPSGSVLGQLVRRSLLRVERTEQKPRTMIYHTTDRFLDLFQLESLDDLPRTQDTEIDLE